MKWYQKIGKWILDNLMWMRGSFDSQPGGASGKKLTGFYFIAILTTPCVFTWLRWANKEGKWDLLIPVLGLLIGAGLACWGINSLEKTRLAKINKDQTPDGTEGPGKNTE